MGRQWQHRILIIDGDERALSVITNFLVNEGFDVATACGTEGCNQFSPVWRA
jgi:DNA-binding response OmpR family regulator